MSDRLWLDPLLNDLKALRATIGRSFSERRLVDEVFAVLARHHAVHAIMPQEFGGAGITPLAACRAVSAAAMVSGSAGLAFAMHLAQLTALIEHGPPGAVAARLGDGQRRHCLIASGTSEVGIGGDILKSRCHIEPHGDGWRVVKQLANVSYLDRADAILLTATDSRSGRPVQRLILIDLARCTIAEARENRFFGMRGLSHRAVTLACAFDDATVFPEPFGVIARTMSAASHLYWAAAWCGLAKAAIQRAGRVASSDDSLLEAGSERLHLMHAMIRDACHREADAPAPAIFRSAWQSTAMKISCSTLLGEIISICVTAAGMVGYAEDSCASLSTIVRDSISAPIMVSNARLIAKNAGIRALASEEL